jgi:hypothetical protein
MNKSELIDNIRGGRVSMAIQRCRKTTIAAIQGPAVGVSSLSRDAILPLLSSDFRNR